MGRVYNWRAFNRILEKLTMAKKPVKTTKTQQVATAATAQAEEKTRSLTIASIMGDITSLKARANDKLDDIQNELMSAYKTYQDVSLAVDSKRRELSNLLGSAELVLDVDAKIAELTDELGKLEAELEAKKAEAVTAEAKLEESRVAAQKEWDYTEAQRRREITDTFDREMVESRRQEAFRKEDVERAISILTTQKATLEADTNVAARIAAAQAAGEAKAKQEAATAAAIQQEKWAAERAKSYQELAELRAKVGANDLLLGAKDREIAELREQLRNAMASVTSIATSATTSANAEKKSATELVQTVASQAPATSPRR